MACNYCKNIEGFPFGRKFYVCPACQQRWYSYNPSLHLWGEVYDDFTWELIICEVETALPLSVGVEVRVLPGYEKYYIRPTHEAQKERVPYPILKEAVVDQSGKKSPVIQWEGDYEPENIFNYQFLFPVMVGFDKWVISEDNFKVVFVGKIKELPYDDAMKEGIARHLDDPKMESSIAYILSSCYEREYENGRVAPLSFMAPLVLLGDPNVGVIKPRYYYDESVLAWELEKFKARKASCA